MGEAVDLGTWTATDRRDHVQMTSADVRLAIFDLDGTLVDSTGDLAAAGNVARASLGLPALPVAAVASFVGDGAEKLLERLTPDATPAQRAQAMAAFKAHYRIHCTDTTTAYDGVPAMLAFLAGAGWHLGVATNKPQEFSERILAHLGLAECFVLVVGGDGPRKPDPGQLQRIMVHAAIPPERTWMIGDHRTDILAGRAAGCRVLWCRWGIGRHDGLAADAVADRAEQIPGLLA